MKAHCCETLPPSLSSRPKQGTSLGGRRLRGTRSLVVVMVGCCTGCVSPAWKLGTGSTLSAPRLVVWPAGLLARAERAQLKGCFPSSGPASSTRTCLVSTGLCLSLVTSLSLTLVLILTPTCRLTLQIALSPALSPQLAQGPNSRLNLVTISGPAANVLEGEKGELGRCLQRTLASADIAPAQLPRLTPGVHIPMGGCWGHLPGPHQPLVEERSTHMEHRAPCRAEASRGSWGSLPRSLFTGRFTLYCKERLRRVGPWKE